MQHGFFNSLRSELGASGVGVTLACPGPVGSDDSGRAMFGATLAAGAAPPPAAAAGARGGRPQGGAAVATDPTRMPTRRVADLILAAAAHGLPEAWIARHPVLLFSYLSQYAPGLAAWAAQRIGPSRRRKFVEGGSLYAGVAAGAMGGGREGGDRGKKAL